MAVMLLLVKFVLAGALLACGVWLLFQDVPALPEVQWEQLRAVRLPAGFAAIGAAIAVLALWRIRVEHSGKHGRKYSFREKRARRD
jgi:hypothetical protein